MADDIKSLITKFKNNPTVTSFLIRMIWQGHIQQAIPEARAFALDSTYDKYTRIAAIRAIDEIGSAQDFQDVMDSVLSNNSEIDRQILTEIVDCLKGSSATINWLFEAIEKTESRKKYSVDGLTFSLIKFTERLEPNLAFTFIKRSNELLDRPPVIEGRFFEISKKFGWLINPSA